MQSYEQAASYIAALTGHHESIVDFRCIHDTNKGIPAHKYRGSLQEHWQTLINYNNQGWGIFININEVDGSGNHNIENISGIRCQAVDLDSISANTNYNAAANWHPLPSFAVQSSPGKFHVYWITERHSNRDGFSLIQRKLRTVFDGDRTIIDPSRVLRLPGFYHLKAQPHLITWWPLGGYGTLIHPYYLEQALAHVNVVDGHGGRHELGDPSLTAPGWEWCLRALAECDPNTLDRGEWIGFTAAYKQAAWNHATEQQIFDAWSEWCGRYTLGNGNDPAENLKNWNSIRNSEVGWASIERRVPSMLAIRAFSERATRNEPKPQSLSAGAAMPDFNATAAPLPMLDGEFLNDNEQQEYFKGCVFVERLGEILTPSGRFMNSTKFNGSFGGKKFIIDGAGKVTDEAWKAATRSSLWQIPKADHTRFLPHRPQGDLIKDALGRVGVNTYKPAIIDSAPGETSPFYRHLELLMPNDTDRNTLLDYIAHNLKYPGHKIPWAPLIQSVEGAGKGIIKQLMIAGLGLPYVYFPKAQELIDSGSKFNAWMRAKLFILVDEIKVDERRDMIEILKPMISEEQIEIQGKGVDQDLEDNFSNWFFFSNYKDAIPINKNARRFAIFYSPLQHAEDLLRNGMNASYFNALYNWMRGPGGPAVVHSLLGRAVERGAIPMRAPDTSSTVEAMHQSRGPVEVAIMNAIADGLPGFRGGFVSSLAVAALLRGTGVRTVTAKTLTNVLDGLGYHSIGRAPRPFAQESGSNINARADLYHVDRNASVDWFGGWQGYSV